MISYNRKVILSFVLVLVQRIHNALAEATMCGTAAPEPTKNCISIRLPWQVEPIHFCVEKEKLKYRGACQNAGGYQCSSHINDLLVATPWECCPQTYSPNPCEHSKCPPAPFNRTCTAYGLDENSRYQCCPYYFCEQETKREQCQQKQLQPECSTSVNNTNCVAFTDFHGCCHKYQCKGEGKPGLCPFELLAMHLNSSTANGATMIYPGQLDKRVRMYGIQVGYTDSYQGATPLDTFTTADDSSNATSDKNIETPMSSLLKRYPSRYPSYNYPEESSCIGDFNCPGSQKCCSNNVAVYSDGVYLARSTDPTYGSCQEPVSQSDAQ